jgi:hypothetical protein
VRTRSWCRARLSGGTFASGQIGQSLMVETPGILQGLERELMVVKHPLSSSFDGFGLEPGRWCVMLSRHRRAYVIVGRDGIGEGLERHQHDCASRAIGADNLGWIGWRAHQALWEQLEAAGRLLRL